MKQPIGLKLGSRTPFVRVNSQFASLNSVDLSRALVDAMLDKIDFPKEFIHHAIWGMVVPEPNIYSIARETVLASKLDTGIESYSVSRACATSLQSATNAALYYNAFPKEKSVTLTGGVESFSSVRPVLTNEASAYFKKLAMKGSTGEKLSRALNVPFSKLMPVPPSPTEYSTGLTMGQHCELMVKEFKIARDRQDRLALRSHQGAVKAKEALASHLISIESVKNDSLIRPDTSMEQLAGLKPVFDRTPAGTITPGNASPFADGAAAVWVLSPEIEADVKPDAKLLDFEYVGVNPSAGLLMGPGKAMLHILQRRGLKWADLDYIEIHEAFAGQVLCNIDAMNDSKYRTEKYGIQYDAGILSEESINPWGSSLSYGHPFGATGARMLNHAMLYLKQHHKRLALVAACTAGALAGACLIERA